MILIAYIYSKLLAQWQGPYEVVKHIGEVYTFFYQYVWQMEKLVSMLKLFHCPTENTEISLWTEDQPDETENDKYKEKFVII